MIIQDTQPKVKKQEDLVECKDYALIIILINKITTIISYLGYQKLKFRERFDKEEIDESKQIEKGDIVEEEYKHNNQGNVIMRSHRYKSNKSKIRFHQFVKARPNNYPKKI